MKVGVTREVFEFSKRQTKSMTLPEHSSYRVTRSTT